MLTAALLVSMLLVAAAGTSSGPEVCAASQQGGIDLVSLQHESVDTFLAGESELESMDLHAIQMEPKLPGPYEKLQENNGLIKAKWTASPDTIAYVKLIDSDLMGYTNKNDFVIRSKSPQSLAKESKVKVRDFVDNAGGYYWVFDGIYNDKPVKIVIDAVDQGESTHWFDAMSIILQQHTKKIESGKLLDVGTGENTARNKYAVFVPLDEDVNAFSLEGVNYYDLVKNWDPKGFENHIKDEYVQKFLNMLKTNGSEEGYGGAPVAANFAPAAASGVDDTDDENYDQQEDDQQED